MANDKLFHLEIVTPNRVFYSDKVEMVVVREFDGEVGILKNHIPIVIAVDSGSIRILEEDGEWVDAAVSEGFMEIKQDSSVMLCDTAEWPDEIDERRALESKMRAEEKLRSKLSKIEYLKTQAALSRAIARLKAKKKRKMY